MGHTTIGWGTSPNDGACQKHKGVDGPDVTLDLDKPGGRVINQTIITRSKDRLSAEPGLGKKWGQFGGEGK